jgi:hypothetical protein
VDLPVSGVQLAGEPVTVSGVADLMAGHGRFRLENPGPDPVHAAVESAWLDVGGRTRPLVPASVFDVERDAAHDPGGFEVAPGTMTFLLGFPQVPNQAGAGEETSVGLRLAIDGAIVEGRSPIVFERRIPR